MADTHDNAISAAADWADRQCSPAADFAAQRAIEAARVDGPDTPIMVPALANMIRQMPAEDQAEVATRAMQLLPPGESAQLRQTLAAPDPHAALRGGVDSGAVSPWGGVRVKFGDGVYAVDATFGDTRYAGVSDVDAGREASADIGYASASIKTQSGECEVSAGLPGIGAVASRAPAADPRVGGSDVFVGGRIGEGPFKVQAQVALGQGRPDMEGAWHQNDAQGAIERGGVTRLERNGDGMSASGTLYDAQGNATPFRTGVDPTTYATNASLGATAGDGRSAREERPPAPVEGEVGLVRRIVDTADLTLSSQDVQRQRKAEFESASDAYAERYLSPGARGLYDYFSGHLPQGTPVAKVMEAVTAAQRGGINDAADIRDVVAQDGKVYVVGKVEGFRAEVDLGKQPPALGDSMNAAIAFDANAGAAAQEQTQSRAQSRQ